MIFKRISIISTTNVQCKNCFLWNIFWFSFIRLYTIQINGTNMRGARHDQAVALLTGHSGSDIYLVVQRDHVNQNDSVTPCSPR